MSGFLSGRTSLTTVQTSDIASGAISRDKIAADAINGSLIADSSIDSEHYADGSIDLSHIASNQIDGSKLAMGSDAAGDILYYNGTDYVRLPKGTAAHLLTMNSGATAPEWAAAPGGANVHRVSSNSNANRNTFTAAIPFDDTYPTNSEGAEMFTCTLRPQQNPSTIIWWSTVGTFGNQSANYGVAVTVFNNLVNTPQGVNAGMHNYYEDFTNSTSMQGRFNNAQTSDIVLSLRMGTNGSSTIGFMNGNLSARLFGGYATSRLMMMEITSSINQ